MSSGPARQAEVRIGIDVGGTNTDAVVIDAAGAVVSAVKVATTPEPIDGIRESLDRVLSDVDKALVTKAMLGTTHPTNAIIERRGLDRVGVLRLAAPSSLGVRPGAAWPDDIRAEVIAASAIIEGGNEYTGAEIAPLDTEGVRRFAGRRHRSRMCRHRGLGRVQPGHERARDPRSRHSRRRNWATPSPSR